MAINLLTATPQAIGAALAPADAERLAELATIYQDAIRTERKACAEIAESLIEMAPHGEMAPAGTTDQRSLIVETMKQCGLIIARKIRERSQSAETT